MKFFQMILANLIRSGKVIIETPNLDIEELRNAVRSRAESLLQEIGGIVYEDEMTDAEKVKYLQELLAQEETFRI